MSSSFSFHAAIAELHDLLLRGDDTATSRLAELLLPYLVRSLRAEFATVSDPHVIESAVHDALIAYFAHPERVKTARGTVTAYLRMSARGDLLNALKQRTIEEGRLVHDVELPIPAPELPSEAPEDATLWAEPTRACSEIASVVSAVVTDMTDRKLVDLMMEGVRETSEFAAVLDIHHLPEDEQRRVVKQHKDRLKKAIHRAVRAKK